MELEKNQLEEEKNNKMENDNHNDLLVEIETLQNQIQELKESKDKILITSDQEKTSYINERKEKCKRFNCNQLGTSECNSWIYA